MTTTETTTETEIARLHPPAARRPPARRGAVFLVLLLACLALGGGSIWLAARRPGPETAPSGVAPVPAPVSPLTPAAAASPAPAAPAAGEAAPQVAPPASLDAVLAQPHVVFSSTAQDGTFGRVVLTPLERPQDGRIATDLSCDRVFVAARQGICLTADRGVITTYRAVLFDDSFRPHQTVPLDGIPSRARVSPDGRYAAMTVFVSGHSYADGTFSTRTTIVDTASGEQVADLEQLAVLRDGAHFESPDFNFWGVTFARDSNRFYATLGTGGKTYLVAGDLAARQMTVLHEGVECPSLSPDETRIAFKKQTGGGGPALWRVAVLDLATLSETVLAMETHNVDDQVEWLDDGHLLYGLPAETAAASALTNVWSLPADGSGSPQLLVSGAWSPAVVR